MTTNCVNCGAPLTGHKCQYCGTEYKDHGVVATFGKQDWTGTLTVGGKEFEVYLGGMEQHTIDGDAYRDETDRLHRSVLGCKRKFTLIEM